MAECSNEEYIVKLRLGLPALEDTLKEVDGTEHLCSPTSVNYLTSKFDELTMRDWEYWKSNHTGTSYDRFFQFLLDRYESCRSTIARRKSDTLALVPINRNTNSSTSHIVNHVETREECRRCVTWESRDGIYTCPGCGKGTPQGEAIGHCLEHCGKYMHMSPNERSTVVEQANWCPVHLMGTHDLASCNMRSEQRLVCGINGCRKHHHKTLHGSDSAFIVSVNSTTHQETDSINNTNEENVLLQVQSVKTSTGLCNCLFDNAATCCLITYSAAEQLNLHGEQTWSTS